MNSRNITDSIVELSTDKDSIIHRIGDDNYPIIHRIITSLGTEGRFEELSIHDIPAFSINEYKEQVNSLIRRKYDEDDEFALQRKMINTIVSPSTYSDSEEDDINKLMQEYSEYNTYVEECKIKAKEQLSNSKKI